MGGKFFFLFRESCGIDLGNFYIVTGGHDGSDTGVLKGVSKYSPTGWLEDLGHLNFARRAHACSHYWDEDGGLVLLVTGGRDSEEKSLVSTEVSSDLGASWSLKSSAALPVGISYMAAVTYNNKVYIFGNLRDFGNVMIHSDHQNRWD